MRPIGSHILKVFLLILTGWSFGQTSSGDFIDTEVACRESTVRVSLTSQSTHAYSIDYCSGDLESGFNQISTSLDGLGNFTSGYDLIFDGVNWHGFVTDRQSSKIVKVEFGNSPLNAPTNTVDFGNPDNLLSAPEGIDFVKSGDSWVGIVGYGTNSGQFHRVVLNDLLTSVSSIEPIGALGTTGRFRDVRFELIDGEYLLTSVNYNFRELYISSFGTDPLQSPGTPNVFSLPAPTSLPRGIDLIEKQGEWHMLVVNQGVPSIQHFSFGNSLTNTPNLIAEYQSTSLSQPFQVETLYDGGGYYSIISNENSPPTILNLEDLSGSFSEIDNTGLPNWVGFKAMKWEGKVLIQGVVQGELETVIFESTCGQTIIGDSTVSWTSAGTKIVDIHSINDFQQMEFVSDTIEITNDLAPSSDFSISSSRCISELNDFSPSIMGLAYSWDFDGDNMTDSNDENPTFQFLTAGTYTVRLDVDDGTCNNFTEQEITIYPEPPVPSFNVTAGSTFCTNNELILSNTTVETGFDDVLTYRWIIDGLEVNQRDTVFTFDTSGTKTITLQSFLPGCSSMITEQQVDIGEGPVVDFSYSDNCFGEAVAFVNESSGAGIVSYAWDFGDGVGISTEVNPFYEYTTAGNYTVSLTVGNDAGCSTITSEILQVNDQPLADFSISNAIENLETSFIGEDLTLDNDSIETWNLEIEGEFFTDQLAVHTFEIPGTYTATLIVATYQGCTYEVTKDVEVSDALFPTVRFSGDVDLCIDEPTFPANESVNADSYLWDFCLSEFAQEANEFLVGSLSNYGRAYDIELVYDTLNNEFFLFAPDETNNSLQRIALGDSVGLDYLHDQVSIVTGGLSSPKGIAIERNMDGDWFGFVGSTTNGEGISRINFGSSLGANNLTIENLGTFDQGGVDLVDVKVWKEGSNYYLVILNSDPEQFIIVDYGNSLANNPIDTLVTSSIPGLTTAFGFDLIKHNGEAFALVAGLNSQNLIRVNFGSSIFNDVIVEASYEAGDYPSFGRMSSVKIERNFGNFYAHVTSFNGGTNSLILDLKNFSKDSIPIDLGYDLSAFFDVSGGYYQGQYFYYGIDNNSLFRLEYASSCGESIAYSNQFQPSISYGTSGDKIVGLAGYDLRNAIGAFRDTISVSTDFAPAISFTPDPSRCITNTNTFTPSLTGLTTYSWDFDEDGIEDSNLENPTHQFATPGIYTVRLDVTDGICSNFVEQEITIYSEPAIPTFTAESLVCVNSEIAFVNTTDETGFDDVLTYSWDFNGEGNSTERNPSFVFITSGMKEITLTSSIPGCESTSEIFEIDVSAGPTAAFSPSTFGVCEGESINFTDASTNGASSWVWDFGDGFTSGAQSPNHLFTIAGNYMVRLTVTDDLGCESTISEEVSIASLPSVSFDFDVVCTSADGIQFMDLSTVEGGDVASRTWFVDAAEVNTEENPILSFENEGSVNIRLEVTSSNGCVSSHSEDVEVLSTPEPNFSISIGCDGEASSFIDLTPPTGSPIGTWFWSLDGTTYNTQNISHTFSGTGVFDVTLEITGQNFCGETLTRTVEILALPEVGFTIDGDCSNEFIALSDTSLVFQDQVVSRNWYLDGANVGNGPQLLLETLPQSAYELVLEVTTEAGCVVSSSQQLLVNATPTAGFSLQRNFGVPGDQLSFFNESSDAVAYQWLLNNFPSGSESVEKTIVFPNAGHYEISLVATNTLGCSDTTVTEVLIAEPIVDLSIGQFEVMNVNNSGTIFIEIENNGNLPIEETEAVIELENKFSVTEQVASLIGIGESKVISLNTGIPLNSSELSYLCVTLNSQYEGYPDLTPVDNEKCITVQPNTIVVEAPYPNPARTQTRVKLVAPTDGDAVISLFNSSGKIEFSYVETVETGLNNFFINVSDLQAGIYFLRLQIDETSSVQRIIKL